MPEDWNARIHIANHTDQPWENPWVQLRYTSQGREETSVLQGRTLAPGESMDFDIPLGNYRIDHPEQGTNTTGGELAIQIHGDGPQELYCSRYFIGFMCREE